MSAETLLGKKIGNYVVASLLGCGGMGEVYLAEHPQIGRKVAIKVLAGELLTTAQLATRFLAEARAVARIEHPNVIDIYDFGTLENGRPYYVMEVLKGRELRKEIDARGKMTAAEVWPYLEQICAGLQAAHDRGIVHRDLKPENVFILDRKPFTLKLLDFGIAKILEVEQGSGLTSSGMVMGTPLFIAPEQALGLPARISPRTDLYSLGVMLYWMLAGQPPFAHEATAILLAMHIRDAVPPLREREPSVPPAIAALVERCLAKEPERRPGSAMELAQAFAEALAAECSGPSLPAAAAAGTMVEVASSPPTLPSGVGRRTTFSASAGEVADREGLDALPRRSTLKWLGLGGVALVVAGGLAFALLREGEPPAALPDRNLATSTPTPAPLVSPVRAPDAARVAVHHDAGPADASERSAGERSAAAPKLTRKPRPIPRTKPAGKPAAEPVAEKPAAKPVAKPQPEPPPKPTPKKIGEGTMDLPE